MDSTGIARRPWWGVLPPLAIVFLLLGGALTPEGLDQPLASVDRALQELPISSAHSGRLFLANALVLLGLGVLAVAFAAIATLSERCRGSSLAMLAAAVAGVACLSGVVVNVMVGLDLAGATDAHTSRQAAAQVLVSQNTAFVSDAFLVAYVGGLLLAAVLMGIALWLGGRVQRWLAVLLPVSLAVGAVAPPGLIGVLLTVPITVVMVILGVHIWRAADPTAVPPRKDRNLVSPR
jgi:hypothetical protein